MDGWITNVKSVTFYASDDLNVGQSHKCLRQIVHVHWPDKIANEDLKRETDREYVLVQMRRIKWNWLEHMNASWCRSGHLIDKVE